MTELSDRDLVRLYWPVELRPAFDALFAIDDAMADVVEKASEPTLAAIKLAWWRDRLEALDQGEVPAEPRLQAVASELLPRGVTGEALAAIEPGWSTMLDEYPSRDLIDTRGAAVFRAAAKLLNAPVDDELAQAGTLYSSWDLARRERSYAQLLLGPPIREMRFPREVRPITALAALAVRDMRRPGLLGLEQEATPGRALALLRHRLTGRIG